MFRALFDFRRQRRLNEAKAKAMGRVLFVCMGNICRCLLYTSGGAGSRSNRAAIGRILAVLRRGGRHSLLGQRPLARAALVRPDRRLAAQDCPGVAGADAGVLSAISVAVATGQSDRDTLGRLHGIAAVSYTHLDVYKRQP